MSLEYWQKQSNDQPLFPELEWSRPESKQHAGKLLIVGGNLHGFAAPAEAYPAVLKAGAGSVRVLLPNAIQKIVEPFLEHGEFAPSTPSGSFSARALAELLDASTWADGMLFAGDMGRNSETAILIEKFLSKNKTPVTFTKDSVDYVVSMPQSALQRPDTTLVLSLSQLQRLGMAAKFDKAITFSMDLLRLVEWLHEFTSLFAPYIIVKHLEQIFISVDGKVSTTKLANDMPLWRLKTAAQTSVWWMQNHQKPYAALTTAVVAMQHVE